ncbi:MAG: rRNA maturation RNase YbeY [Opitutaceae bacterium]
MTRSRARLSSAAEKVPVREISIANRHPRLRFSRRAVAQVIAVLDSNVAAIGLRVRSVPTGELSIVFLTDSALARLHADFLDDPATTDVITFEGNPLPGTAGEICVSADTAAACAAAHGHDFSTELTLYLVHGWLHLAGHDDLEPAKKRAMRRAESRALRVLKRERAVPAFTLRAR